MPRLPLIAGAIAVVIAIALLGIGSGFFVDALWFRQLGVLVVFRTALLAKLACFTLAFAACYAVVAAVGLAAVRYTGRLGVVQIVFRRTGNGPSTLPEPGRQGGDNDVGLIDAHLRLHVRRLGGKRAEMQTQGLQVIGRRLGRDVE